MTDVVSLPQTMIFGHLWQSVALAAVLAVVLIAGRKMRGSTRYGLSAAAFLAALALPLAAFIPGETIVASLLKQLDAPVRLVSKDVTATPVVVTAAPAAPVSAADPMVRQAYFGPAPVAAPAAPVAPIARTVSPRAHSATPAPLFTLPAINLPDMTLPLLAIWLGGALFLLARTGRDLLAVERLVARATPADLPDALQRRMKGVRVVVSPEAPGPMAAGLFRPAIVLPPSIALASPGMAALLEHERAHIERRDMLAALGQRVVLALLWWSPALYWMSRRIDEEREVACDEAAVDRTGDARAFARSLTTQAENQLWVRAPKLAVGAIGPRSQFGRRIKRLIEIAKSGGSPAKYSGRLAFAGLALAVAIAAMVTPRFTAEAQQPGQDGKSIDLTSPDAREKAKADAQPVGALDGKPLGADDDYDFNFQWDGNDFAGLGQEIGELMASIGPELGLAMADLSPELQAELDGLSTEMAALGVDLSSVIGQEVMREMPAIMDQVRQALEEAGIDPDHIDGWQDADGFDAEELRQALQEARDEMKHAIGPELQAEIRQALAEAREEIAAHREEIQAALQDSKAGMAIAREALAAARAEIDAARARGDFDKAKLDGIKFDFDRDVMEELRKAGITFDGITSIHMGRGLAGRELFEAAEDCNAEDVTKLIVEKKNNVNAVVPGQGTALMAAAGENCVDAARSLINAGADVNLGFPGAGTPLSLAADNHATPVAQLLLNRGADANASVPGFDTPLIAAAREGDLDMVKLLVENGADVNLTPRTSSGTSPLQMATRHGNDEVANYLRSKGAVSK
jgi:beta-lactamase regulating signal transducer with metallopeptidase domain